MGLYDFMDATFAEAFEVTVKEYIETIEKTTNGRMLVLMESVTSEDPVKIEKARKIFNSLRK